MPSISEAINQLNKDLTARDKAAAQARARSSALEAAGVAPEVAIRLGADANLSNTYLQQYLKPDADGTTAAIRNYGHYESLDTPEAKEAFMNMVGGQGRGGPDVNVNFGGAGSTPFINGVQQETLPDRPRAVGNNQRGISLGSEYYPLPLQDRLTTLDAGDAMVDGTGRTLAYNAKGQVVPEGATFVDQEGKVLFDGRPSEVEALASSVMDVLEATEPESKVLSPGQTWFDEAGSVRASLPRKADLHNVPRGSDAVNPETGEVVHGNVAKPDNMSQSFYDMFKSSFQDASKSGRQPVPVDVNGDGKFDLFNDSYRLDPVEGAPEPVNSKDWGPGTSFRSQIDAKTADGIYKSMRQGYFPQFKVDEDGYVDVSDWKEVRTPSQFRTDTNRAKAIAQRNLAARDSIRDIIELVNENGRWAAGFGSYLSWLPESSARDVSAKLETVASIVAFSRLQEMRDNSATGGALGQISNLELTLLSSTLGSIAQSQSSDQLISNLRDIDAVLSGRMTEGLREEMERQMDKLQIEYSRDPEGTEERVRQMAGGVNSDGTEITKEDVAGWFQEPRSNLRTPDGAPGTLSTEDFERLLEGG